MRIRFPLALAAFALVPLHPALAAEHGVQKATIDSTCAPCQDFYRYANGAWLSTFQLPPSYSSFGSFDEVFDRNQERVHDILTALAGNTGRAAPASDELKIGVFYAACMDSARADREGAAPLEATLARIDSIASKTDLAARVAELHSQGTVAMFRLVPRQDFKHSDQVIPYLVQGGLGLPDRDYYTRDDSASAALRDAYVAHVARTLALTGTPESEARSWSARIMEIENALANASMTNVQLRDPNAIYHPMAPADLATMTPNFGWKTYFAAAAVPNSERLNVGQPDFFHALDSLIAGIPLTQWKFYLRFHAASAAARWLDQRFVDEDFAFRSLLTGDKEIQPRWKRCMVETDNAIGEALGREFVKRYFTPATKSRALEMVHNLEAALRERLGGLEWMNDTTRAQATAKLGAFGLKIGYPDRWRDYSALAIGRGPFLADVEAADRFEFDRRLKQIAHPVDRGEWNMTPPTVNAYYNASLNEIVFPAGIFQPPFYDPLADDACNYGAMGAVIGHEMTHGFDDRGRKFDAQGNLREWWTSGDAERFKERAAVVIDQFNDYVAVDTMHVNGKLTTGENIADLGGLAVAYRAYQHSLDGKRHPAPIDGMSAEQRFFMAYAQVWRELVRPEQQRLWTATDQHSPGRWRVNGPVSNLTEFARAFGCKAGDPMVRPDSVRVRIW